MRKSEEVDRKIVAILDDLDCPWDATTIRAFVFGAVCSEDLIQPTSIISEIFHSAATLIAA